MARVTRPILIAGGGIGGLTLAVALQQRGIQARVLERASALAPVGAGLVLQPNAVSVLATLGLLEQVVAAGCEVSRAAILDHRGARLGQELDLSRLTASFGAPSIAIHRGRLHRILEHAVAPGTITLNQEVKDYETRGDSVTVRCADLSQHDADVLVAADGLRSVVRQRLVGDGQPRYSGQTSWRGVTRAGASPRLTRMSESWGRGARFGLVDVGHGEVYWFAVIKAPPGGTDRDARADLLARFRDWHEPVCAVLEATPADQIVRTDISDREPIVSWHQGHVVLLGDAAHPMTPNLGQGACQAIEDAVVLADALATCETVEDAFLAYETRRVARANAIVLAARRLGQMAQLSNPAAAWLRNLLMRLSPERLARKQLETLWKSPLT